MYIVIHVKYPLFFSEFDRAWSCSDVNPHKNSNYANTKLTMAQKKCVIAGRNAICLGHARQRGYGTRHGKSSVKWVFGTIKHAKQPKKSIGLHTELTLLQKEPVQLDDDLRCHDLSLRLQLYEQIDRFFEKKKTRKVQISRKSVQWEPSCSEQTDRATWRR